MKKIKYPVLIDDIDVFEKNNPTISVNVFDAQGKTIRLTTYRDRKHQVNMIYLQDQYRSLSNLSIFLPKYKINLPKNLSHHKKGILKINNFDNKCFLWCIIAGIKKIYKHNVKYYLEYENEINMNGIEYHVKITDLDKFENHNINISVSVFGYENEIYPLRISKVKREKHIILLFLTEDNVFHYCLITDIHKLCYGLTKHQHKTYLYQFCLNKFASERTLNEHESLCLVHGGQKTTLPNESNKWLYFKEYSSMHKIPFIIYSDFESFCSPINKDGDNISKHIPSGFCYVIIDYEGKIRTIKSYSGDNVVDTFFEWTLKDVQVISEIINKKVFMKFTEENEIDF